MLQAKHGRRDRPRLRPRQTHHADAPAPRRCSDGNNCVVEVHALLARLTKQPQADFKLRARARIAAPQPNPHLNSYPPDPRAQASPTAPTTTKACAPISPRALSPLPRCAQYALPRTESTPPENCAAAAQSAHARPTRHSAPAPGSPALCRQSRSAPLRFRSTQFHRQWFFRDSDNPATAGCPACGRSAPTSHA